MTDLTHIWALTGVDSEMVEEIVPLSEVLTATGVIAFKDLDLAFRLWVDEAKDFILLGVGDVLLDSD